MLADHRGVGTAGLAQHVERDTDFHDDPPIGFPGNDRPIAQSRQPMRSDRRGQSLRRPRAQLYETEAEEAQIIPEPQIIWRGGVWESKRQAICGWVQARARDG